MHGDPLARLADVETQQIYIAETSFQEETSEVIRRSQSIEVTEVSEIILEEGEVFEGGFGNDDPWLEPDNDFGTIEPDVEEPEDVDEVINENERGTRFEGHGPTIIDLTGDSDVEEYGQVVERRIKESSTSESGSEIDSLLGDLSDEKELNSEEEDDDRMQYLTSGLIY